MKFDILAESILSSLVNEGRLAKKSKYANISVDVDKLTEKLNAGDFEVLIKAWAGSRRYSHLSEDQIKDVIKNVASEIAEYQPSSFEELNSTIESVVDNVYANKGPHRKTYNARLTKSISNLITHKEYGLVSMVEAPRAEENDYDLEGLTQVESAILEFISNSDTPTNVKEVNMHFSNADDIIDSLIQKGFITRDGDVLTASSKAGSARLLDTDNNDRENPLDADEDIRTSFSRSMRQRDQDEYDSSMGDIFSNPESMSGWSKKKYWGKYKPED